MRDICVIVDMIEASFDIIYIIETFPCFVKTNKIDNIYYEVNIKCRQEDAADIEEVLSRVV